MIYYLFDNIFFFSMVTKLSMSDPDTDPVGSVFNWSPGSAIQYYGSADQVYGSADPDKNFTDPQHWLMHNIDMVSQHFQLIKIIKTSP
jgi:hypothetical protein